MFQRPSAALPERRAVATPGLWSVARAAMDLFKARSRRWRDDAVAQALDQIGDWWTLLIVREAVYGKTSFSVIQRNLGIARNILSNRLVRLVKNGVLARKQRRAGIDRYSYHLTDKGCDLLPLLVALMQWGGGWTGQ